MKVLRVPPELTDGQHWTVMKLSELTADSSLLGSIRDFVEHGVIGDHVVFEISEMSEEEIDALPEI